MIHTYDASNETLVRAKPLPVTTDDTVTVEFDVGYTGNETLTAFDARMERLDTLADVAVTASSLDGQIGAAQVSNFERGVRYRLLGTFTRANGTTFTKTLILDCFA